MRNIILVFLLMFSFLGVRSENPEDKLSDINIFGHVVDKHTGEHLPYVTIQLKGTTYGTVTDASGHYMMKNLPKGEFVLQAKCIGYRTVEKNVTLVLNSSIEVNFETEEDNVSLDEVVVSANRNETTRRSAPTMVKVLDDKLFEAVSASCLAQGLTFQPGVRVETNCQNCGFQQVRINGLDGPYTQILIDSRSIFSALGGVYGLEQIPANMIERVEVVRGGGSALFGSSAVAGTINIITREPLRNSGQLSHNIMSIGCSGAFDNTTSINASMINNNSRMGIYVFGQSRYRSAYDHDGDGYTELPVLQSKSAGFRSYFKIGTYSRITAEYHGIEEYRRGGDSLSLPPHQANIAEQLDHSVTTGSFKYDYYSRDSKTHFTAFSSMQHIDRKSYYGAGQDPNAYGNSDDLTWVGGVQTSHNFDYLWFMPSELTMGLEYNQDRLKDVVTGYGRDMNQDTRIASFFLQNEWKTEHLGVLLGGRLDEHNMLDGLIFSPRINIRYNPSENINFRASYSEGFRAPQAFDEDLHIAAVGGTVSMIELSSDLKEERSQSVSVSADMYKTLGGTLINILVEGFYTNLKDVFVLEDLGYNEDGILIKERQNGSGAEVMGVNIEGRVVFNRKMELQGGLTLERSRYKEVEVWSANPEVEAVRRMFRTPDVYGYMTLNYSPIKRLTAYATGTYTGQMLVQHAEGYIESDKTKETCPFFDAEAKLAYDLRIYPDVTLQMNAGIRNIFDSYQSDIDKGSNRDSGYIYGPTLPRSVYMGVRLNF